MQEKEDEASRTVFTPKLLALSELCSGILVAIYGTYFGYPHLFEVWFVTAVVIFLVFSILLPLAISVILREWLKDNNSMSFNVIFLIPAFSIWVLYGLGSITQSAGIIFLGFLVILLASWHFRIVMREK